MTLVDKAALTAALAERDAARAEVARLRAAVLALHEDDAEVQDIHGELICKTCGMSQSYPCATRRAALAATEDQP